MLEEIRIRALGVIDDATLELGPGLTAITGETGAGKTMVVSALGLLLGARADSGAVRAGARSARVEGLVRAATVEEAVLEAGGEVEDDRVLLARTVSAEGRSRAHVGGASVPLSTLAGLADSLLVIHGQNDQHRLLRPQAQLDALDAFAGDAAGQERAAWEADFARLRAVQAELAEVTASVRERAREADLLRFGLAEIEAVTPVAGEDVQLAAEEARLGNADSLRLAAERARETLASDSDGPDALGALAAARSALAEVSGHDEQLDGLAGRVAEVAYLLSDVAGDLASYAAGIDSDPARLAAVSERRAALTALMRKYGDSIDEVLAWQGASGQRLLELDGTDERIEALTRQRDALRAALVETGARLTKLRTEAAASLSDAVTGELAALAMPHARFSVALTARENFGAHGMDEVEFLLAANTGGSARPLGKGASGGELSRVMLALEVSIAQTGTVPTLVFDEVDAGVGGKAAVEVGRRLARLASTAQVLVVTHLPQVAAYANAHVVVRKETDGTVTTSGLTRLDEAARSRELARMFAGQEDSDSALAHAEELLSSARPARAEA